MTTPQPPPPGCSCSLECEIEWRTRLTLAQAQRVMEVWFRDQIGVTVDEYRLRRYACFQRRVGMRVRYLAPFTFRTIGSYMRDVCGLDLSDAGEIGDDTETDVKDDFATEGRWSTAEPQPRTATTSSATRGGGGGGGRSCPNVEVTPFADIKTTNCAHTLFYVPAQQNDDDHETDEEESRTGAEQRNCNQWTRVFLVKRSLELQDVQLSVQDDQGDEELDRVAPRDDQTTLRDLLSRVETIELERSDNNLGYAQVRKMYRTIVFPSPPPPRRSACESGTMAFRIAIYAFIDEYQQIRYELGLEHEFNDLGDGRSTAALAFSETDARTNLTHVFRAATCAAADDRTTRHHDDPVIVGCQSSLVARLVDPVTAAHTIAVDRNAATEDDTFGVLETTMAAMSQLIERLTRGLTPTEKPMVRLQIDWLPNSAIKRSLLQPPPPPSSSSSATAPRQQPTVATAAAAAAGAGDTPQRGSRVALGTSNPPHPVVGAASFSSGNTSSSSSSSSCGSSSSSSSTSTTAVVDHGNTCSATLLSFTLSPEERASMASFTAFVQRAIMPRFLRGSILLKRKIDGVRVYATFNGDRRLYCDNGDTIEVDRSFADHCLSTDHVYQLEMVPTRRRARASGVQARVYYLTELVSVRNSYNTFTSPLGQSFSPSRVCYSYSAEQQWPYGLMGVGLSAHQTHALVQFWVASACELCWPSNWIVYPMLQYLRDHVAEAAAAAEASSAAPSIEPPASRVPPSDWVKQQRASNAQFVAVPTVDSLRFLSRIRNGRWWCPTGGDGTASSPPSTGRRTDDAAAHAPRRRCPTSLAVNLPHDRRETSVSELVTHFQLIYADSVFRMCDILFLSGQHYRCRQMLFRHFDEHLATQAVQHYTSTRRTAREWTTALLRMPARDPYAPPTDGYIMYMQPRNAWRPAAAADVQRDDGLKCLASRVRQFHRPPLTSYKLKPYQTIELLCVLAWTGSSGDTDSASATTCASSSLRGVSFCVRAQTQAQQSETRARAMLYADLLLPSAGTTAPATAATAHGSNHAESSASSPPQPPPTRSPLTSEMMADPGEQLANARWKRIDGTAVTVHLDPRIDIQHGGVYEFLCYTDNEFFLVSRRIDKVLPDAEDKANGIVFERQQLTKSLTRYDPL